MAKLVKAKSCTRGGYRAAFSKNLRALKTANMAQSAKFKAAAKATGCGGGKKKRRRAKK